ncbi:hypothetical protein RHDC4_03235 [Rhodocyclaceae bacterium]|nr:hypothetical protein RHDC4_03235 [Rhodocyclaceae bacterium]
MRSLSTACCLLFCLCACNPVPPLSNADKARFVYELIDDRAACDSYRQRLSVPALESPAIEAIYQEAIKGGCIKRNA